MIDEYTQWHEQGAPRFTEDELQLLADLTNKYKYVSWLMFWPLVEQHGCVIVSRTGWAEIQERERIIKELAK